MQVDVIRSRVNPDWILHKVVRKEAIPVDGRVDLSDPNEALQVAAIGIPRDKRFPAHHHIEKQTPGQHITQEAWVVIAGGIRVDYYDVNNELIDWRHLAAGDLTVTYAGGHAYCTYDHTAAVVYEFKTGPYRGVEADKVLIDGSPDV